MQKHHGLDNDRVLDSNIDPPGRFDARLGTIFF
jgi:hypothetical protein